LPFLNLVVVVVVVVVVMGGVDGQLLPFLDLVVVVVVGGCRWSAVALLESCGGGRGCRWSAVALLESCGGGVGGGGVQPLPIVLAVVV
jgi:hypothetical protein